MTGMTEELNLSVAVEECKKNFSDLQFMEKNGHEGTVVEVQDQRIYFIPNASYMSVSSIVFFKSEGCLNYAVRVLFTNVQTGVVKNVARVHGHM